MSHKLLSKIKPWLKSILVIGLVLTLVLGNASQALAARTGGRIGGGSWSAPSRTYSGGYRAPAGGYGYGGGIGFPFLLPFFTFGGGIGSLFTFFVFIAIANFLVNKLNSNSQSDRGYLGGNSKVSVVQVQVGLLAQARQLQEELNELARNADTGTSIGRAMVLQESTLALLRHPEYWVYASTSSYQGDLEMAEAKFNQLTLAQRSKFTRETLTNVNSQLRDVLKELPSEEASSQELALELQPLEYIIVTILVGARSELTIPKINDTEDLRQAIKQIGSIGSDRLLAIEVLWTPQAEGDTLTTDDLLVGYPDLKLV